MIIGIDASNLRGGGGVTHLIGLLGAANPHSDEFVQVIVWGGKATLGRIKERPWLIKRHVPALDEGLAHRALWQRFRLSKLAKSARCTVLLVPGGTYGGDFHPAVTMSRNLLPFEWGEMARYGLSILTLKWLLLRRAQSASFRRADGLIYLTQYAKEVVERVTGQVMGKVAVIPHGVDEHFFCTPRCPRSIEKCSPADPLRLLYVSNIDAYKHQWIVAEAVAKLHKTGLPIIIDFVGSAYGPSWKKLNAVLQRVDPSQTFIRYVGPLMHEKLPHLYHAADIGVFASS